jgi:hypothetical protein
VFDGVSGKLVDHHSDHYPFIRIQPQMARSIHCDALSMLLLEGFQRPIDDSTERGSLPSFRGQHVVRPVQCVQTADKGIALLGMLIQRLGCNGLEARRDFRQGARRTGRTSRQSLRGRPKDSRSSCDTVRAWRAQPILLSTGLEQQSLHSPFRADGCRGDSEEDDAEDQSEILNS